MNMNGEDDISSLLRPLAGGPPVPASDFAAGGEWSRVVFEAELVNARAQGVATEAALAVSRATNALLKLANNCSTSPSVSCSKAPEQPPSKRCRNNRGEAVASKSRGLRHFSSKVCEKVELRGRTTYQLVADELVADWGSDSVDGGERLDEKNIRRRVYDAINVLLAMDIIRKEKKEIIWIGLPNTSVTKPVSERSKERMQRVALTQQKAHYLQKLVEQHDRLQQLLQRNKSGAYSGQAMYLPFVLIQVAPSASLEIDISPDMSDVKFDFREHPFQVYDDADVLARLIPSPQASALASGMGAAGPTSQL